MTHKVPQLTQFILKVSTGAYIDNLLDLENSAIFCNKSIYIQYISNVLINKNIRFNNVNISDIFAKTFLHVYEL